MRMFVALTPPEEIVDELRSATAQLRAVASGLRWTPPEQWHVTIVFLGEVGDGALGELTRRLHRAAARHPPLSLAFVHSRLGAGPNGTALHESIEHWTLGG